jgi:hypothetical protein
LQQQIRRNGAAAVNEQQLTSPVEKGSPSIRPSKEVEPPEEDAPSTGGLTGSKKERKGTTSSRFTIYKVNKASRKKREKSSAKKERKATKTLAIVLGKKVQTFNLLFFIATKFLDVKLGQF